MKKAGWRRRDRESRMEKTGERRQDGEGMWQGAYKLERPSHVVY